VNCVIENSGITWNFEDGAYFLRDDMVFGLCSYRRHSLFRTGCARAVAVMSIGSRVPFDTAIPDLHDDVQFDRRMRGLPFVDPTTVFLNKRGQS
jgi:hypothetical protein